MKFVAEFYLVKDQRIATEVIEAEDIQDANLKILRRANNDKRLMFWEEIKEK